MTPEPSEYPMDPDNPPEFPGKLPRELSVVVRDQLQKELAVVTFPRSGQYAEYTPDE
ncbi:hypothetical protein [Nocardia sp. NPDC004750]